MLKGLKTLGFFLLIFQSFFAQDTLYLNKDECEAIFLKNNLSLLAEELQISKSEAEVIQAKVWPNPTLSIGEVNLWGHKGQVDDELPPLFGEFGRNQQFTIELEQEIILGGKRKKLKELKEIDVEKSKQYFEEILRNLKLEFRRLINELNYLQQYKTVFESQINSVQQLVNAYKTYVESGFLGKAEYMRLNAFSLSLLKEVYDIENEMEEVEFTLKSLMNLSLTNHLVLNPEGIEIAPNYLQELDFEKLKQNALNKRPDFRISEFEKVYAEKLISVEKAERVPNIAIRGEYDRGSGIFKDFIGFGVSIDLPVFNRNKGSIRIAELELQEAEINQNLIKQNIEKELIISIRQLQKSIQFIQNIEEVYETELDSVLSGYTESFKNRNIGIVEYIDFLEAYIENKGLILRAKADVREKAEELNFVVGENIIN